MEYKYLFASFAPAVAYFFSFVFLRLWSKYRDEWHVLGFGVSFFVAGTAIVHIGILAPAYDMTHALLFHVTCHVGLIGLNWSVAKRVDATPPFTPMIGWAMASTCIVIVAVLATDDAFYRIFAVEAALAVQYGIGMWGSQPAANTPNRGYNKVPYYWLPMVLLLVSPPAIYFVEGAIDPASYSDSLHWTTMILLAPLTIVVLSTNILLTLSDDLAQRIKHAHQTDFLTGLPNRQAFEEQAEALFAEATAQNACVSMVLADIDNFKHVNDTFGHHAGDDVLSVFGDLLRTNVQSEHLVGRVGGEEFCIVLSNLNERAAKLLATQLCVQFASRSVASCPPDQRFSASFGVVERSHGEGQAKMYRHADRALYAAKHTGKNRVVSYSQLRPDGMADDPECRIA
ncbi:MAG: GGDEF domain-containing protein [Pseudomonadota bacterium]